MVIGAPSRRVMEGGIPEKARPACPLDRTLVSCAQFFLLDRFFRC
jgi:hypothetical protein